MSGSNKQSAPPGSQNARYSSSPFVTNGPVKQDGLGLFPPPAHYRMMSPHQQRSDQFQVTSPAGSYVAGSQGPVQGPGGLRAMSSTGPPNQASTPPNADLKVQTIPSQMAPMQFIPQVRPQPYFRGATPSNQGTRMPGHQQRPQAATQYFVHQGYMHPSQQVYLQPTPMIYTQNAQSQQTPRFMTSTFPVYTGGQQLTYPASYLPPQANATVTAGYPAIFYQPNQTPMMTRPPVQQPTAAPPAPAPTGTISAAQLGIPPPPTQGPTHSFSRTATRERRKNAIAIIDPDTGANVLNEIYENSSQPTSGESSARQTPKPNQNAVQRQEAKDVREDFAKQVAMRINEEKKHEAPEDPSPPAMHQHKPIPNYPPPPVVNEYHHPPPQSSNPPPIVHSSHHRYDVQSSNLHINAKEFVSSSKLSAKDTTPVVSANTDAVEVIISKKETSPAKGRKTIVAAPASTKGPDSASKADPIPSRESSSNCDITGALVKDNSPKPQDSASGAPVTATQLPEKIGAINQVTQTAPAPAVVPKIEPTKEKKVPDVKVAEPPVVSAPPPVTSQVSKDATAKSKNNTQRQNSQKNANQQQVPALQQQTVVKQQPPQPAPVIPAPQPPKSTNKSSKKSDINLKGANKEGTDMDAFNDNSNAKNEVNANSILSSQNDLLNANTITAQQNDAAANQNRTVPAPAAVPQKTEKETNANSISNHKPALDNEKPTTIKPATEPITTNHVAQAISTVTATAPKLLKGGFDVTNPFKEQKTDQKPEPKMAPFTINHNNAQDEPDRAFVQTTNRINANHVGNGAKKNGSQIIYPDGQWAPHHPEGSKKYEREFLMVLQNTPLARQKPPNLPEYISSDDRNRMMDGRLSMGGRTDFTNIPFGQGYGTKGSQSRDRAGVTKRNSQSKMGGQRPNDNKGKPMPKVSISLRADVKLHETENAWKPSRLKEGEKVSEETQKTELLYKKFRSVLNKLTPQKFETLLNQVHKLNIDTNERLQGIIDLVFEKAIDEPNFSVAYARLCKELQQMQVATDQKEQKGLAFKTVLVTRCQQEFEKQSVDETDRNGMIKKIDECSDAEKKKELEFELEEYDRKIRMRSVGCIRFIGELFKQQMLTANIMSRCLQTLLNNRDEESLECLCKLLTTVGKELESKGVNLNQIFNDMKNIADNKKPPKVSSRIRFMLQDVIDLRNSRWVPRRTDNNPKTIDQIQKEAEVEQLNIQVANMNTPRKDDRGGRSQGGRGDSRGPKQSEDGWNSVGPRKNTQYTIQTDKLRITPLNDENVTLGPSSGYGNWGRGALGAKTSQPSLGNMFSTLENMGDSIDRKLNSRNTSGYNSKGPSMERSSYKSSYDGRGSNSRSGSQHRSNDNSTPMRPSSSSNFALNTPSQQAPMPAPAPRPAPVPETPGSPKMTEDQQIRRIHNALDEFLNSFCIATEFWQDVVAAVPNDEYAKVVNECYNRVTEKSQRFRLKTGDLFGLLIHQNLLHLDDFCAGFEEFLSIAEDLEIDIPKIWAYIAENIVHLIYLDVLPFSRLKTTFRVIIESNRAKRVLQPLFAMVIANKGPNFLKDAWAKSQVQLADFMPADEVDAFVKDNNLGFLVGGEVPVGHSELTYAQIHDKLLEFYKNKTKFDDIVNWISANVGDRTKDNKFIRVLATTIFEDSIVKNKLVPEVLSGHSKLIHKYVDNKPNLELQCLYALQALVNKLEHPQGLLLTICDKLYEDSFFSQESFIMWEGSSDPAEQGGKGVALKQLTSFFTQLKENEEDDDYGSSSNSEADA